MKKASSYITPLRPISALNGLYTATLSGKVFQKTKKLVTMVCRAARLMLFRPLDCSRLKSETMSELSLILNFESRLKWTIEHIDPTMPKEYIASEFRYPLSIMKTVLITKKSWNRHIPMLVSELNSMQFSIVLRYPSEMLFRITAGFLGWSTGIPLPCSLLRTS